MAKTVLIAAGGTGGHLFPAEALALGLKARGWAVHLGTDHRVESYGRDFPAEAVHLLPSATFAGGAFARLTAGARLGLGFLKASTLVRKLKLSAAIGFGGYPTVPPILAGTFAGVPTIIHEQNAVLGRANRFLAPRVTAIAATTARIRVADGERSKVVETGNPVRAAVLDAARRPYPPLGLDTPLSLLVFGGSQGARFLSELMPPALERLEVGLRQRLKVVQQCRPEDMDRVRAAYIALGVTAELAPFFRDLPARIASSHLVVSRSGASTVAELGVIGRPAIMVPLPHALDQDQRANAEMMQAAGGGWMIDQAALTPERLATELTQLFSDPARLTEAARAARTVGRPDAVERLADLVDRVAAGNPVPMAAGAAR